MSERRFTVATNLLYRVDTEENNLVSRIVAIDDTWVKSYEPGMKGQATEWHQAGKISARAREIKDAHDIKDALTTHRVEIGQTVNGWYDKGYIQKLLRPAIHKKRPNLLAAGPIIIYDNAAPNISEGVTSLFARNKWETLPHPPNSPDLSSCDVDLFPTLNENMQEVGFEELEDAVAEQVRMFERGCLATGIQKLPSR